MGFCSRRVKTLDPFLISYFRWVKALNPFLISYFRRVKALNPFLINNSDVALVNNPFLINNSDVIVVINPFLINNSDAVVVINPFVINNLGVVVVNNPFLINNSDVVVVNNPFVINNLGVVVVINLKRIEGRHCLVAPPKQYARDLLWDGEPISLSGRAGSLPPRLTPHYHADDGRAGDGAEVARIDGYGGVVGEDPVVILAKSVGSGRLPINEEAAGVDRGVATRLA